MLLGNAPPLGYRPTLNDESADRGEFSRWCSDGDGDPISASCLEIDRDVAVGAKNADKRLPAALRAFFVAFRCVPQKSLLPVAVARPYVRRAR